MRKILILNTIGLLIISGFIFLGQFAESTIAQPESVLAPQDYIDSLGGKVDYWHKEKMPLRVFILDCGKVPGYSPQFKQYFISACQSWSEASLGKVAFKFVQSEPCDIKVFWTNDRSQLIDSVELGQAEWQDDQDGMFKASIKLLTIAQDGRRPINDQEAKLMCLHELGHALGLVKHSPYRGDIMDAALDYSYNMPLERIVLSVRDKNTIARLYTEGDAIVERLSLASSDPQTRLVRLCFRGASLVREGKYDAAIAVLDQALTIDPKSVPALNAVAEGCFEQGMDFYSDGNYQAALRRLERFISVCDSLKISGSCQAQEAKRTIQRCKDKLGASAGK